MTAITLQAISSSRAIHADPARTYYSPFHRSSPASSPSASTVTTTTATSYFSDPPRQCSFPTTARLSMDLPQPLEPRPNHDIQKSRPEGAVSSWRHDVFAATPNSNGHALNQSLPGLKDILTSASGPSASYHNTAWNTGSPFSTRHVPDLHVQYPQTYHPPLVYPPRSDQHPHPLHHHHHPPPFAHEQPRDLPILETHPVPRQYPHQYQPQPSSALPAPPHAQYPDPNSEYADHRYHRPRQSSMGSYQPNPLTNPYAQSASDNGPSRLANTAYDRAVDPAYTTSSSAAAAAAAIESSKRYLGVKDYPGEGSFHVYEGGHRIPTHVDGETVNPQWGLTKANKPRKRLAMACLDCREKKIKCEPGANSCLQCEKARRPCRRAQTSQSQHDIGSSAAEWSPSVNASPPANRPAERVSDPGQSAPFATSHPIRDVDSDHLQKRRAPDEMTNASTVTSKKQRSASPSLLTTASSVTTASVSSSSRLPPSAPNGAAAFSVDDDPYAVDHATTLHLLDCYFTNVNHGAYCIFPRDAFMRWVMTCSTKSIDDRMVVHAMLAMASVFDRHASIAGLGERFASVAKATLASKFGRFSLHVIHTRLLLALYDLAMGSEGSAWEHCGLAMRAISALRFNDEEGCVGEAGPSSRDRAAEYDLSHDQAAECRRRTFWAGFMMDRFNGFCGGMICTVNTADVYLRLPCPHDAYERNLPSHAPFFDNGIVERTLTSLTSSSPVDPMAYLALITSIWGDVMNFTYRAIHRSSAGYAAAYETFYTETGHALDTWLARLPGYLQYNSDNLMRSLHAGYAGTFVSMHVLHHFTMLKLNRCMRHSLLRENVARNICEAHAHARALLGIISALNAIKEEDDTDARRYSFSTPFVGFAVLSAVDIVGAGGPDDDIKPTSDSIHEGSIFLRALAQNWNSAHGQARACEMRYLQLENVKHRPYKAPSGCWLGRRWGLQESMEKELDLEDDCIYGVHDRVYFDALDHTVQRRPSQPAVAAASPAS